MREKIYFIFLFGVFICNCGYTTRGFIYKENKIAISPIVNKIDITSESRRYSTYKTFPVLLEKRLTNALINKFNVYKYLKVVNDTTDAFLLECAITDYDKEALRYSDDDSVMEQRLRLTVHVKLSSKEKILKEKDVIGETSFFLKGKDSKSESVAQQELIDDTARRIVELVIEEW